MIIVWEIFVASQNFEIDDFMRSKLDITMNELLEEKEEALQVIKDWRENPPTVLARL